MGIRLMVGAMFDKVLNWLRSYPFDWFMGDGYTFVLCCVILTTMTVIVSSKKLREIFF